MRFHTSTHDCGNLIAFLHRVARPSEPAQDAIAIEEISLAVASDDPKDMPVHLAEVIYHGATAIHAPCPHRALRTAVAFHQAASRVRTGSRRLRDEATRLVELAGKRFAEDLALGFPI